MKRSSWFGVAATALLAVLIAAGFAVAQTSQVQGLIVGRSGATSAVPVED